MERKTIQADVCTCPREPWGPVRICPHILNWLQMRKVLRSTESTVATSVHQPLPIASVHHLQVELTAVGKPLAGLKGQITNLTLQQVILQTDMR